MRGGGRALTNYRKLTVQLTEKQYHALSGAVASREAELQDRTGSAENGERRSLVSAWAHVWGAWQAAGRG